MELINNIDNIYGNDNVLLRWFASLWLDVIDEEEREVGGARAERSPISVPQLPALAGLLLDIGFCSESFSVFYFTNTHRHYKMSDDGREFTEQVSCDAKLVTSCLLKLKVL